MDDSNLVAGYYAGDAPGYRALWAPVLLPASSAVVARLPLTAARRVLDLGCGVGALEPVLRAAAPGAVVVEADRTLQMLQLAPARSPRCQLDARRLPFASGSFDAAVLAFMLFHVPAPHQALAEVRRVLRRDGWVAVLVWGAMSEAPAVAVLLEELDRAGAPEVEALPARHELMDSLDKLSSLLSEAGFARVEASLVPWEFAPDLDGFLAYRAARGITGRRLAALPDEEREVVVARARERLAGQPAAAFRDASEVLSATGVAP